MARCSGIKADGGRCGAQAIRSSEFCVNHHPDYEDTRRRRNSKGGKRGGRGRPAAELARLQRRFEELAEQVLSGEVERARGAVAGQLLNGARACVRDALTAREQEELVERMEALEQALEQRKEDTDGEPRETPRCPRGAY
jgi:hypothetical protein